MITLAIRDAKHYAYGNKLESKLVIRYVHEVFFTGMCSPIRFIIIFRLLPFNLFASNLCFIFDRAEIHAFRLNAQVNSLFLLFSLFFFSSFLLFFFSSFQVFQVFENHEISSGLKRFQFTFPFRLIYAFERVANSNFYNTM